MMDGYSITLPAKWERLLKNLAKDHDIDPDEVVNQLCEWAFSNPESKEQFRIWLDDAYPPQGETEDETSAVGEEASEEEEENEEESEEESHEHRD